MLTFEVMGTLVFVVGLFLLVVSVVAMLVSLGTIGPAERIVLFLAGAVTCIIGYYMATRTSD